MLSGETLAQFFPDFDAVAAEWLARHDNILTSATLPEFIAHINAFLMLEQRKGRLVTLPEYEGYAIQIMDLIPTDSGTLHVVIGARPLEDPALVPDPEASAP